MLALVSRGNVRQANVPVFEAQKLSRGIVHNVCVSAVAVIGGLSNGAKRNAKADQLRPVPRHNVNKENESNEDTEPRHCRNILLGTVATLISFLKPMSLEVGQSPLVSTFQFGDYDSRPALVGSQRLCPEVFVPKLCKDKRSLIYQRLLMSAF